MRNTINLIFVAVSAMFLLAGCAAFHLRIAGNYYDEYAYARAIPNYEKVLRKVYDPEAASRLADAYRKTGNSFKAEIWYRRLANSQYITLDDKRNFAEVLMENGKYEEAKTVFSEYLLLSGGDKRVRRLIQACDSIHLFFEDTTIYDISVPEFNREIESNFSPSYFRDGIVFLSDRPAPGKNRDRSTWTGKEYLDLFFTRPKDEGGWTDPVLLRGDINGLYDEGPAVFTNNDTEIYFTRTDYSGKNVEKNQKNISTLKLYHGKLINNLWTMQELLPFNSKDYSVGHPAISPDGSTLYFVSDMPWGYGGTDIYKVNLYNGKWGVPENLGALINSEGNEMFPFLSTDSVLYFASDGHIGLGGLDIYSSYWNGVSWSKPENLQYPVNSSKDDFGFIIGSENSSGYFSSNRKKNIDMVYRFTKNPPIFNLELTALDDKSGKAVKTFEVTFISRLGDMKNMGTGKNGSFSMPLNPNSDYKLMIKAPGYLANHIEFSTAGKRKSETITGTVNLDKVELNKAVRWPTIDFVKKETNISATTEKALDSLATILKLNPELQIEIISHTDSRGSFSDNLSLSKQRAETVTAYLVSKGISPSRVFPVGFGEGKLLNNCRDGILCLEEDHQVNNRIEVKVIYLLKN